MPGFPRPGLRRQMIPKIPRKVIFQVSRRQVMELTSVFYRGAGGILTTFEASTRQRQESQWQWDELICVAAGGTSATYLKQGKHSEIF